AATRPDVASRALSSIEETSRGALREMRALLGVLRASGETGQPKPAEGVEMAPAPGLADLPGLAARSAEAGVTVDLDVRGAAQVLDAGLDLAAYRVVQEAITNVIKHARADQCKVLVDRQPDALLVQVTDQGAGTRRADSETGGHGIAGMRERV